MLLEEDINTIVRRTFDNKAVTLVDYRLSSYSNEKVGFLGDHYNLELKIQQKGRDELEVHKFFVKALPEVSEEQSKFLREGSIFTQEAAFFNFLFPELKKCTGVDDWCPKCFLANERVIVLEDLRSRGFAMREGKILSEVYVKSAVRAQARLHASSLLVEARLGKSMLEVCPDACNEQLFNDRFLKAKRLDLCVDLVEKVAKKNNQNCRQVRTALYKGFMQLHKANQLDSGLGRVVCHGDTWPNNYMFDTSDPPKCVLIDFQVVRYAPRMYDVIQLIYLSMTRDCRTKEENLVIEAYYEELCKSLEADPSVKKPSMDEILNEFEELRLPVFLACILYYPVIALSQKELNALNGDSETLNKKLLFRQNNDYVMELFNRDEEMSSRLSELVTELVEYCEKHPIPTEEENNIFN